MDPTDFLKTAAFLNGQNDEHHLRTSMSRSYYAAHLYIRQFISKKFLAGRNFKHDSHQYVINCCNNCESKDMKSIGVILGDLRQVRTNADYKMHLKITSTNSQDAYDNARDLLSDFKSKLAIPANHVNRQKFAKSSQQQAKLAGILV